MILQFLGCSKLRLVIIFVYLYLLKYICLWDNYYLINQLWILFILCVFMITIYDEDIVCKCVRASFVFNFYCTCSGQLNNIVVKREIKHNKIVCIYRIFLIEVFMFCTFFVRFFLYIFSFLMKQHTFFQHTRAHALAHF